MVGRKLFAQSAQGGITGYQAADSLVNRYVTLLKRQARLPQWWVPLYDASCNRSVFLSGAWLQCWLEVYGDDFDGFWVRWEEDGVVVGGCLFLERTISRSCIRLRTLYLNATGEARERTPLAEFNSILHITGFDDVIAADLARLLAEKRWDRLLVGGHEDSGLLGSLIPRLPAALVERELQPAPFVDLTTTAGTSFKVSLSSNTRSQVRRSQRLYEQKSGRIRIERASSLEQALQYFHELTRMSNARWLAKGETGSFSSPAVVDFHRRLLACLWPLHGIDLLCVRAGNEALGYLYNFLDRGKVCFFQSGFAYPADARLKPGLLTHFLAIEHYAGLGFQEYDFLAGDARYKRSLAKRHRDLIWTVVYRDRLAMRLLLWTRRFKPGAMLRGQS